MKRISIALFTFAAISAIAFSAAFAQSLPQSAIVTVTTDAGAVVGMGSIEHGQLELDLSSGLTTSGAALNIAITGSGGTTTLTATIDTTGAITVTSGGQSQDLASYASAAGLTSVEVSTSSDTAAGGGTSQGSESGDAGSSQEDSSQASGGSQDQSEVSGSSDSSSDSSGASADSETETETHSAGSDDSVDVGTSLDSSTSGSGSD